MAGNGWNRWFGCKSLEKAGHGFKWLEMARMAVNCCKLPEIPEYWQELPEIAGNGYNGWVWLLMARNCWIWLTIAGLAVHGCKVKYRIK